MNFTRFCQDTLGMDTMALLMNACLWLASCRHLKVGLSDYHKCDLKDWVLKHPGQVVLTVVGLFVSSICVLCFGCYYSGWNLLWENKGKAKLSYCIFTSYFSVRLVNFCRSGIVFALCKYYVCIWKETVCYVILRVVIQVFCLIGIPKKLYDVSYGLPIANKAKLLNFLISYPNPTLTPSYLLLGLVLLSTFISVRELEGHPTLPFKEREGNGVMDVRSQSYDVGKATRVC